MRRVILDASALLTWFDGTDTARRLRSEYEDGLLRVVVPRDLATHLLGSLAASRRLQADQLARIAAEIDRLGFEIREPPIDEVVAWLARGLTTTQAPYAALASTLDLSLMTADPDLLHRAASVARSAADG